MAELVEQKESEAKVLKVVSDTLPDLLAEPGTTITITACDPGDYPGALSR